MIKPFGENQQVVFIDAEKKEHKGVIIEVLHQLPGGGGSARIDYTERTADGKKAKDKDQSLGHHTAIAEFSEEKKPLTFYFPPEPTKGPAAGDNSTGGTHK